MTIEDLQVLGSPVVGGTSDGSPVAKQDDMYSGFVDYFGFDEKETYYFPDGKQWLQLKKLTEGDRARYESSTSKDIRINRRTEDATLKVDASLDRQALLMSAICGWNLVTRNRAGQFEPVTFSNTGAGSTLAQWIAKANPNIINKVVDKVRQMNPWLMSEMTEEMIDEEIRRLEQLRSDLRDKEAAEKNS
jgi:restriction endonuclease Mrr